MHNLFMTIIHPGHFWRRIKMSELSELYVSMTLKSLALSLVAIFVPVYLYQEGFTIIQIGLYYAFYFALRTLFNLVAGYLTARYGPKHVLSYSYVLLVVFLGLLLTLPIFNWPLFLVAAAQALFNSLFFIAYHVDFSKVHTMEKGGSELSMMNILVRSAAAVGPFIGGLVATLFSINVTIMLALVLVLLAIWPLMLTAEPLKRARKLELESFNFKDNTKNAASYVWLTISRQIGLTIWPLYISVFIFTDNVYAKVGFVASISIAATLLIARFYGKLIDKNDGRKLLNTSAWFDAVVHLIRPHIKSLGGVSLINMTSEFAETGIILPYTKGFYDEADASKNRIAYVTMMEAIVDLARGIFWFTLTLVAIFYGEKQALVTSFYIAALITPLITMHKYKAVS